MKRCPKCERTLEETSYYKNKRQYDGLSVWCKEDTKSDNEARKLKDPEKRKSINKKYYEANKDSILQKSSEWAKNNREKRRITEKKYRESNRDKRLYWESNRRSLRLDKADSDFPENGKQILIDFYGSLCMNPECLNELTEKNPLTMDHVIPLTWTNGYHTLTNMQLLCLSCNASKGNRRDTDFREGRICELALIQR